MYRGVEVTKYRSKNFHYRHSGNQRTKRDYPESMEIMVPVKALIFTTEFTENTEKGEGKLMPGKTKVPLNAAINPTQGSPDFANRLR